MFSLRQELLQSLLKITDEEQAFLDGKEPATDEETRLITSSSLLKEGKLVGILPHARFMRSTEHTHDYVELVYQYCGQTTHIINGEYISLNEGEFLLLPTDSVHEVLPAGVNDIAINFVILPRFFKKTFQATGRENNTPLQQFILQVICDAKSTVDFLHFDARELLAVSNLIDSILWTHLEYAPKTGEIAEKALELILLYLVDFSTPPPIFSDDKLVSATLQYVEKNYIDGSLAELAKTLNYNMTSLSYEIRRRTGKTYLDLVHEKRISRACFLLRNTTLPVSQIIYEVGYSNASFFHRLFKKIVGVSPKKVRTANADEVSALPTFSYLENKQE